MMIEREPNRDSAQIFPPRAFIISLQIDKPNPVPPLFVLVLQLRIDLLNTLSNPSSGLQLPAPMSISIHNIKKLGIPPPACYLEKDGRKTFYDMEKDSSFLFPGKGFQHLVTAYYSR